MGGISNHVVVSSDMSERADDSGCSWCNSCGGDWPIDAGGYAYSPGIFCGRSDSCGGDVKCGTAISAKLCCKERQNSSPPGEPVCNWCSSCGGSHPEDAGGYAYPPGLFCRKGASCSGSVSCGVSITPPKFCCEGSTATTTSATTTTTT